MMVLRAPDVKGLSTLSFGDGQREANYSVLTYQTNRDFLNFATAKAIITYGLSI